MKRFFILLCIYSSSVFSASALDSYSFSFESIQLNELARVVFSDVLARSYVFDPEFLADTQKVGFVIQDSKKQDVKALVFSLLDRHGFKVSDGNVLQVVKNPVQEKAGQDVFYYKPKFRSVNYISDLVSSLFEKGRFSSMRKIRQVDDAAASNPKLGKSPVEDSGTSALSMVDKEKDAFIFQGPPDEIERLKKLLVQVDVPPGQVLVRAHVYEVTTGAREGSAFSLALDLLGARLSFGQVKDLGNTLRIQKGGFDLAFSALASDSRFKVISSPSLRVKSGENARFSVGSDVPVLGAVQFDKNGNSIQSIEYKPSGVILDIKPKIRGDEIELHVNQQLSSFIPTTSGVNNSPTLLKREISTNVGVSDGDVIVLGGLDENRTSNDSSGLPFLPEFLRSSGRDDSKIEILLVLETQKI